MTTVQKKPLLTIGLNKNDALLISWIQQFPISKKSFFFAQRLEDVLSGKERGELKITRPRLDDRVAKQILFFYREEFELTNRYLNYLAKHPEFGTISNSVKLLANGLILDPTDKEWRKEASTPPDLSFVKRTSGRGRPFQNKSPQETIEEVIKKTQLEIGVASTQEQHVTKQENQIVQQPTIENQFIPEIKTDPIQTANTVERDQSQIVGIDPIETINAPEINVQQQPVQPIQPVQDVPQQIPTQQQIQPQPTNGALEEQAPVQSVNPMLVKNLDKLKGLINNEE